MAHPTDRFAWMQYPVSPGVKEAWDRLIALGADVQDIETLLAEQKLYTELEVAYNNEDFSGN